MINDSINEIETILSSSDSATTSAVNAMLQLISNAKSRLASSTDILPSYDIDKAQALIVEYEAKVQQKRVGGGKKKFSFKTATTVKSSVPAPTPITQAPTSENKTFTANSTSNAEVEEEVDPNRSIQKLSDQTIILDSERLLATDGQPGDFSLSRLHNCEIRLQDLTTALRLSHLTSCRIICAPVNGSIFVQHCKDITLISASRQIRIHDTFDSTFSIYTQSRPTIEHCKGLKFAPYSATNPKMTEWLQKCEFALERNEWENVQDFNWLRANSPNWSVLPVEERSNIEL